MEMDARGCSGDHSTSTDDSSANEDDEQQTTAIASTSSEARPSNGAANATSLSGAISSVAQNAAEPIEPSDDDDDAYALLPPGTDGAGLDFDRLFQEPLSPLNADDYEDREIVLEEDSQPTPPENLEDMDDARLAMSMIGPLLEVHENEMRELEGGIEGERRARLAEAAEEAAARENAAREAAAAALARAHREEDEQMEEEFADADSNSSASEIIYAEDRPTPDRPRRWYVPVHRVHAAIRELIAQSRRGDGGVSGMVSRDNLRQQIRRVIFSLHHSRRQRHHAHGSDIALDIEEDEDLLNGVEPEFLTEESPAPPEPEPENAIRFDTNLPAEHSYLGANMDRVSGVNYLECNQQHHLMLFMHQHVLFPGEVLPFMISGTVIESDIDAQNGLLFGVCFPFLCSEQDDTSYGVTCQIYEKGTDARGNALIKSRALQRFVVKNNTINGTMQFITSHPTLKCYGYIRILPEIYLPEPMKCIQMGSMSRFRDIPSMESVYKRFLAATTPFHVNVFEEHSMSKIVEKARTQLAQHKIDAMPMDPIHLSFWLVRNLHLSESIMKSIFLTDSVNVRMKLIASTFKDDSIFTCRYCGNRIAKCAELFAMSVHGVQSQYCNSAGYIHETNTVYHLLRDATTYSGDPSTEFSWFPGYQWHIVVCKICSRHIGWEFKGVEKNLVPTKFFGISSSSVRISSPSNVPTDPNAVIYRSILRLVHRDME